MLRPLGDNGLPTHCSFLRAFVRKISNYQGIDALQERLLPMSLIQIKYPTRHPSHAKDNWRTDE